MFRLARVGDKDSQGNTIIEGSPNMKDQGLPVARVGDKLSDGSVITTGNPTIMVDGKPAAIVGSQVSNGCAIVGPCSSKVTTGFQVGTGSSQSITPTNLQAAGFNPSATPKELTEKFGGKEALAEEEAKEDQEVIGICCIYDYKTNEMDQSLEGSTEAQLLTLPPVSQTDRWINDPVYSGLFDTYMELYGEEEFSKLLFILSSQNMGYSLSPGDFSLSSWDIDHTKKQITLDNALNNLEAAESLKDIVAYEFEGRESFWDIAWRVTKGTGKTVLGGAEVVTGAFGVIVPEPATTVGGAALITFGAATMIEGTTQIFNLNEGEGFNPIEETFKAVGSFVGGQDGEQAATIAFAVTNIVVSLGGSYKILKVGTPNGKFIFKGTYTQKGFGKFYDAGFTIGRLQLAYPLGGVNGKVIINVTNNSNQWLLRIQNIEGQIVLNGRIIGVEKWHRITSPKEVLTMLAKLIVHGAKH